MPLLQKLKDIRIIKQNYRVMQKRIFKELSVRYPYLMNCNMADITNTIELELKDMLCCSLKYNSVRIQLKATGSYNGNETFVNVQRGEPGFYYPNSGRGTSDIRYMNLEHYINDKDNMFRKYVNVDYNTNKRITKDELRIELSELKAPKHAPRIHADKLDFYFKILREVMAYKEKFLCYTDEGYRSNKAAQFKAGRLHFALQAKSMNVSTMKFKLDEDGDVADDNEDFQSYLANDNDDDDCYSSCSIPLQYKMSNSDIIRMLDYSSPGSKHFSGDVHLKLKIFIEDYEIIKARLEEEEIKKRLAYKTCQDFIKQLRVYTLPFKVLGEIKK